MEISFAGRDGTNCAGDGWDKYYVVGKLSLNTLNTIDISHLLSVSIHIGIVSLHQSILTLPFVFNLVILKHFCW